MTLDEAIKILKIERGYYCDLKGCKEQQAFTMAIKALEQEPILDKIRAEIEKAVWEDVVVSLDGTDEVRIPRLEPDDVFAILDKYKAESENKK